MNRKRVGAISGVSGVAAPETPASGVDDPSGFAAAGALVGVGMGVVVGIS